MLIGEYQHTIDTKKRLAVPAKFRKDLGEQAIVTKWLENCLVVYTLGEWEKEAKKLEALSDRSADARNYSRLKLASATDVELDKLGRILIPDYLKKYACLEKNVAILGLSNRFEIWDSAKWEEHRKKTETAAAVIAERLKELGA